ncbi:MAG: Peptidoglycan-binding domain 1 protein [Candidatus Peregrinibacteria bacterium GW2011_GWA2_44_7]|nr:MAG: Peptidoglycan-binding domain 1 protein [Candidatus Peregrinibacteria bacterium GW2011_GWA2_44_7]
MTKIQQKLNAFAPWKLIFWLTLSLLILFAVTPRGYAAASDEAPIVEAAVPPNGVASAAAPTTFPYKKTFIISGYYTPLPDQTRYFKGSYEAERRLNGNGVRGADGTPVYQGLMAGPPDYPYGTKIAVPGVGVFAVHDRGGAIHGNRLDIWLGRGEEGLRRALGWGMRTVEVTVYGVNDSIKEYVDFSSIPLMDISAIAPHAKYFTDDLAMGDQGDTVRELQRFLKKLGYLAPEPTGTFGDETRLAVQKFQLEKHIIDNVSDYGAGNFGPRTRFALESAAARTIKPSVVTASAIPKNYFNKTLALKDTGAEVVKVQDELSKMHFLGVKSTGVFDATTSHAVFKLQQAFGIVKTEKDSGAGMIGPKTLVIFNQIVASRDSQNVLIAQATSRYVPHVSTALTYVAGSNEMSQPQSLNSSSQGVAVVGGDSSGSVPPSQLAFAPVTTQANSATTTTSASSNVISPAQAAPIANTPVNNIGATSASTVSSAPLIATPATPNLPTPLAPVALVIPSIPLSGNGNVSGSGGSSSASIGTQIASVLVSYQDSSSLTSIAGAEMPLPVVDTTIVAQKIFTSPLALNDKGDDVKMLQGELKSLSFYNAPITGNFGKTTQHAVTKLQLAFGIVKSEKDSGAGIMGAKTMALLNSFATNRATQKQMIASVAQSNAIVAQRLDKILGLVAERERVGQ